MIPSVYISIFGLGLSTVTDLKNAITAKLAQNFQVNWTHIADKKLQILLLHEDFAHMSQLQEDNSNLRILKLNKNKQWAGQIVNDVLYLPLSSTHALSTWLSQFIMTSAVAPAVETAVKVQMPQHKLSHHSISKAFNCIYQGYANLNKFIIQSNGQVLSFFDIQSNEFYSNTQLNIHEMTELEVLPADLNSIVRFKKQFKARDLKHGIWQFVWDHLADDVPEFPFAYRLSTWPQPLHQSQRNVLLKMSAYFSQGHTVDYVQQQMQVGTPLIHRYLFACRIAQMLTEIPVEEHSTTHHLATVSPPAQTGAVRGFLSKLRKKLGL
jgi:predicted nucleic-acid-binding Zn-ribbon protein